MTGNSTSFVNKNREVILKIVSGGVAIALAMVLSNIRLFRMPMGGSVTLASVLPIVVFCMAFGPSWGFAVALVYSLLQLIDAYMLSPFQVILDYILGYLVLGITGFAALPAAERLKLKNPLQRFTHASFIKALIMTFIAYVVRWFSCVLSGVIFYAEYAGDMNPWLYSMSYNGAFLAADFGVTAAVMAALYFTLKKAVK